MKTNIKTIAEAANVSRGTVDKVLHDRPGVSEDVREKVRKITSEMGYKVNLAGRLLAYQKTPIKIGVILLSQEDALFNEVHKGIQDAYLELEDSSIKIEYCFMRSVTATDQLRCIKELIKKNVRGIALPPIDEVVIREELNKLSQKNIKIITYNTDILGIEKLCFIGQDTIKSGRVAGQLMGKLLPHGGNVAIITGPSNLKCIDERKIGFEDIIKYEYTNIKVIDVIEILNDDVSPFLKAKKLFKQNSDLNGIFVTGRGIDGVVQAIQELNKNSIKFVCFDLILETLGFIKDNIIDFTITQEPYMQGYLPVKIFFDYFFKDKLPDKECFYTKLEIKTKENI